MLSDLVFSFTSFYFLPRFSFSFFFTCLLLSSFLFLGSLSFCTILSPLPHSPLDVTIYFLPHTYNFLIYFSELLLVKDTVQVYLSFFHVKGGTSHWSNDTLPSVLHII